MTKVNKWLPKLNGEGNGNPLKKQGYGYCHIATEIGSQQTVLVLYVINFDPGVNFQEIFPDEVICYEI